MIWQFLFCPIIKHYFYHAQSWWLIQLIYWYNFLILYFKILFKRIINVQYLLYKNDSEKYKIWSQSLRWFCKLLHLKYMMNICLYLFSSVQFSRSVVSDSLRPHEPQHARPPCPSPTPGVHSDSRPSSQWCHPAISCEELTHWKRLWCWEGLGAGGEGDDRGWDGWMASLTRWTWVW